MMLKCYRQLHRLNWHLFFNLKKTQAKALLSGHGRGPAVLKFLARLDTECDRLWRQGRRMCEAPSIGGNPCIQPVHKVFVDDVGDSKLAVLPHVSGVRYVSACSCGRRQVKPIRISPKFPFFLIHFLICRQTGKTHTTLNMQIMNSIVLLTRIVAPELTTLLSPSLTLVSKISSKFRIYLFILQKCLSFLFFI